MHDNVNDPQQPSWLAASNSAWAPVYFDDFNLQEMSDSAFVQATTDLTANQPILDLPQALTVIADAYYFVRVNDEIVLRSLVLHLVLRRQMFNSPAATGMLANGFSKYNQWYNEAAVKQLMPILAIKFTGNLKTAPRSPQSTLI